MTSKRIAKYFVAYGAVMYCLQSSNLNWWNAPAVKNEVNNKFVAYLPIPQWIGACLKPLILNVCYVYLVVKKLLKLH